MKKRWFVLLLLCLLLSGCSKAAAGSKLIPAAEGSYTYCEALQPFLSAYTLQEAEDTLYAEVSRGHAAACFDVQAIPAMERGVGRYWYPHLLATVVLAVDRTRIDAAITGWHSLLENGVPVGVSSTSVIRNMLLLGALSYGLNQEAPAKEDALWLLERLNENSGFELEDWEAPILICLDYEAAAWNRSGGQYEIIVPGKAPCPFRWGSFRTCPWRCRPGWIKPSWPPVCPLPTERDPAAFPAITGWRIYWSGTS